MKKPPYYITTPIYYVNDIPHIGHAYTTIASDMMARFMRLDGRDVFFATGTDEHGQKNAKSAEAKGCSPQEYVDTLSERFRQLCVAANTTPTDFVRTTEPRHHVAAQALWQQLMDRGHIYLGKYAGWYSVRDEAYFAESELMDGKAPTGAPVEWVEEPSYFFRLSQWQEPLLKLYQERPDFIMPRSRLNETIRFVESGLRDLSVSRTTFSWGVPVPGDPAHIMYVWLDALTNYLTCVGYPDTQHPLFQKFWPASVHVVGKDILRFHGVYWPAFLMAAGLEVPQRVYAHGWWTNEGQKISKSLGNVIDPDALFEQYGLDAVRYYMVREVPFGADGDFSHETMVQRMNSNLANDYGNLVQRVLSFVYKNCEGRVAGCENLQEEDNAMMQVAEAALDQVRFAMEACALTRVCDIIWGVIGGANRYIDAQKPWSLRKTDLARMDTVLAVLVDVIRRVALLTQPIMPDASGRILDLLTVDVHHRDFSYYDHRLSAGVSINEPYAIFPRY